MAFLSGYKTYIVAILLAALAAGRYMGLISPELASAIEALLLGGGFAALRSGLSAAQKAE